MPRRETIPTDDHALLGHQVAALFAHDERGRIVSKSTPVYAPAPRLFLGRSLGGALWRFRDDVDEALERRLTPLLLREPTLGRLDAPRSVQTEIVAALAAHRPITEVYAGPAWRVPGSLPPPRVARLVTPADTDGLRPHYPTLASALDVMSPCAAVFEDDIAVCVCFSARISTSVAEAGLDTTASARGRGYGPDAVLAWAAAVRATGRLPLYSTSWDNVASRRVAEKLGLTQYAVDLFIY